MKNIDDFNNPLDFLLSILKEKMPKKGGTIYLKPNGIRYENACEAIRGIKIFISSIEEDATFNYCEPEDLFNCTSLALEVNCTLLSFTEVDQFCTAIKYANAIDITPKTDGTLSIIFDFKDVFVVDHIEED